MRRLLFNLQEAFQFNARSPILTACPEAPSTLLYKCDSFFFSRSVRRPQPARRLRRRRRGVANVLPEWSMYSGQGAKGGSPFRLASLSCCPARVFHDLSFFSSAAFNLPRRSSSCCSLTRWRLWALQIFRFRGGDQFVSSALGREPRRCVDVCG